MAWSRSRIYKYFELAAQFAASKCDQRSYRLGAVAIRNDGTIVGSLNGPCLEPCANVHAEWKLGRKLDRGSVVFVVRISGDGSYALAAPCNSCFNLLKSKRVKRIYYTSGPDDFGSVNL
jgi:deoxycytidylate deaminase